MDLIVAIAICLIGKFLLWYLKQPKRKRKKKKREPILAQFFGVWYYWVKANRSTGE